MAGARGSPAAVVGANVTANAAAGDGKFGHFGMAREHLEEAIVADGNGKEDEVGVMGIGGAGDGDEQHGGGKFSMRSFLWHDGSVWDAWFSCASNQVLLTLPYSFSQLGMLSGVLLQIFYCFLGSWTAYLISVLYVEYRSSGPWRPCRGGGQWRS